MSNIPQSSNPMASMFELQRQSIRQGQQFMQQGMQAQKQVPRIWEDAISSQRTVQKTGLDASRSLTKSMIEMMEAAIPSEQPLAHDDEEASHQQHEAFESLHQAVEDQFEAVEEINSQTWETIEEQLEENTDAYVEFVDQSTSFTEESVNAYVESLEDVQSEVREGMEYGTEHGESIGTSRMDTDIDDEETA